MNETNPIATWDVLWDLGFQPDANVLSDISPGLSFQFGNFKLNASCVVNMWLAEVVLFTGFLSTPRTLAEIDFQMPRRVRSREQCAAWIVWNLDQAADGRVFVPIREARWVLEGRQNRDILPWVEKMAAYDARSCCVVDRDWLRLALKALREILELASDETPVIFSFNGAVLTILCARKIVVLPAEGTPWPNQYTISAEKIRHLPKRLMRPSLEVSIWEDYLDIGGWRYSGVIESKTEENRVTIELSY